MSKYYFISSIKYCFFLMIVLTAGCTQTQQAKQHVFVDKPYILHEEVRNINTPKPLVEIKIKPRLENVVIPQLPQEFVGYDTVWQRLFSLYRLENEYNQRIDKELNYYIKHPEYLQKVQRSAAPYLYFILNEIEAKNLPGEFALLPIVESAFNPKAISKSAASGLWQFMPATGRYLGLKQDKWHDERNDVYRSTKIATLYLKQLSGRFDNNWLLGLASYNAGEGTIKKAVKKNNNHEDYWSLDLREETTRYIPKLLALAKIFANAEQYNIPLLAIKNQPFFERVAVTNRLNLTTAAHMAETDQVDFISLNPAFKRWSTHPNGSSHLLIEIDKVSRFKEKLRLAPKEIPITQGQHIVKSGENLGQIARKYHTSVKMIQKNNLLTNTFIKINQVLIVPTVETQSFAKKVFYTVKKGDTFWNIARQFAVSTQKLARWNNLSLSTILRLGQRLIVNKS